MRKKILVVDDDPLSRELLSSYLTNENYEVLEASSAGEAKTLIFKEHPDLILLDVMMPGEDGFSFCEYIKKRWQEPFLPVILVTALNDRQSKLQGLRAGADDFLSKPLDSIELIIKVRNMLKIRELHANLYNELVFAKRVQENLFFPENILQPEDKLFYRPCRPVGGDLVEIWEQKNSRWALLADASGHGPSAALIATAVKTLIDKKSRCPASLLAHLNAKLCSLLANEDTTYYVTAVCIKIDHEKVCFAGAGHPPCLLKSSGSQVCQLVSQTIPLGIRKNITFQEEAVLYQPEGWLFLYSDGLFDIISEQKLKEMLTGMDREEFHHRLTDLIRNGEPQDDISFLILNL